MSMPRLTGACLRCVKQSGKAIQTLAMIHPGARVGVAVSGGVDSWTLLECLRLRQKIVPFHFDLIALHINPGFDHSNHAPLVEWLAQHGVAGHVETSEHGPRGHSPENRTASPCFYCARLRRKRLFDLCKQYKLTHLAFGHTADDLVTTFFMNLMQNGRVAGLSIKEAFFQGRLTVIRPLALLEKKDIVKAAARWKLPVWQNPCPSAGKSSRAATETVVKGLCSQSKLVKTNIFKALQRWQIELTEDDSAV